MKVPRARNCGSIVPGNCDKAWSPAFSVTVFFAIAPPLAYAFDFILAKYFMTSSGDLSVNKRPQSPSKC